MDKAYYQAFYEIQNKHWWFVAKKKIILDQIAAWVAPKKNQQILDIGCGSGLMLNALEKIGDTYGADFSDEAVAFSRDIFKGPVERGALPDSIPFEPKLFTIITALDVIEHIDDDVGALRKIKSRLSPDGFAVITVPAFQFLWSKHDDLNHHKRRYTLGELENKLLKTGFKIEKITYFNTFLFPLIAGARIFDKILNRTGETGVELPTSSLNFFLERIFSSEAFFLRYINFPIGVSVMAIVRI